jgi:carbon-monoxide dehydrogenase medium subunit
MLSGFNYAAPRTRGELLDLLAAEGQQAKLLAGGTDLLVNMRAGAIKPALVIDVKRVEGFSDIAWSEKEGLVLKAGTTINDLLRSKEARDRFPLLAACAHDLASYQVRNRATVIGNVVNASPCSDMAPALLCLGARARISSKAGTREVAFKDFFTGVKKTVLKADELLELIIVPPESAGARGSYRKLKRINGHDLGIVGVAVMKKAGLMRIGISSAAPTPVLVDGLSEGASAESAVAAVRKAISPISDLRCSKEYREHMVEVFVRRLLEELR